MSLWGFSQNSQRPENKEKNNAAFKVFVDTLPDIEEWRKTLVNLRFFALCPNGKRIPVEAICEEYARDPNGLVYRTFDDRIILVIQAIHPDLSEPYWNQAFYLSTGESSGMDGTWLPFNGILMKGDTSRKIYAYTPRGNVEYRNRKMNEKQVLTTAWFSKADFAAPTNRPIPFWSHQASLDSRIKNEIEERFGSFFLPEGDYLEYKSRFNRFGTISYALASHALGGNFFESIYSNRTKDPEYPYISFLFPRVNITNTKNTSSDKIFAEILVKASPLQPCFKEMAKTYPITKPNTINAYIDSHKAISYMNAFRQEKLFPPGLSFVAVPMSSLGYSMPLEVYWNYLDSFVKNIWFQWKTGKKTLDDIRYSFEHLQDEVKKQMKQYRSYTIMPNEPEFNFNLHRRALASKPIYLDYYGGKPKATRRGSKKKRSQTRRRYITQ